MMKYSMYGMYFIRHPRGYRVWFSSTEKSDKTLVEKVELKILDDEVQDLIKEYKDR